MAQVSRGPDSTFKGSSVLVTGASGFIGTHLCRSLSRLGARVSGTYLHDIPAGDHAEWIRLDLTDLNMVRTAFQSIRPAFVFHLAGSVLGNRGLDAVLPTFQNNLAGSISVMIAAHESGCCERLIITNSMEEPERGDPNPVPSSPYAASKFASSAYARMFHALYGLPIVIARVFMVYGPGQKDHRKLVPYTILQALDGNTPELSSGVRMIDWIHVNDVVDGLLQMGCKAGLEGETVDLGSGHPHSIKEIVEKILGSIDPEIKGQFGAEADRPMEQQRIADTRATKDKLGWQARIELDQGLAKTIAWYREYRDIWRQDHRDRDHGDD